MPPDAGPAPGSAGPEPGSRPRVILALGNVTEVNALLPYGERLAETADVHVLFASPLDAALYGGRIAGKPGMHVLDPGLAEGVSPWLAARFTAIGRRIPRAGRMAEKLATKADAVWRHLSAGRALRRLEPWCRAVLMRLRPAAIVTGSDRDLRARLMLLRCARESGVPIVVIPAALPAFRQSLIDWRMRDARFRVPAGSDLRSRHPAHVIEGPGGEPLAFFNPRIYTPALAQAGVLRGDPWVLGGMWGDVVLAPGRDIARQFVAEGLPAERVRMVGSLELDGLAAGHARRSAIRAALLERFGLAGAEGTIVGWSVHQHFEHDLLPAAASDRLMREVAKALLSLSGVVFASLHPKMDPARYAWLDAVDPRLRIVPDRLETWLGACDLFTAAGYSSTIGWAAALGVPTAVYDTLQFRDSLFDRRPGVRVAYDGAGYAALLQDFADPAKRAAWIAAAQTDGETPDLLDGRSMDRIKAVVFGRDATADIPGGWTTGPAVATTPA